MTTPTFEFRLIITADDPVRESWIVKKIASEFIRLGVPMVSVIADGEHNNYVDGEVYNVSENFGSVFGAKAVEKASAYVATHNPSSIN